MQFEEKLSQLKNDIAKYTAQDVMVAFSGGADSSLLLKLCCLQAARTKAKVYAVTAQTMLHPRADLEIASEVAKEMGAIHKIVPVNELMEAGIENNPQDRCYRCKKCIFMQLRRLAEELNTEYILEGTNEDDLKMYRPGIQAVKELGIISPLAAVHMTKAEVRAVAKKYNISVADRPSAPCLATRFPYGTVLDAQVMRAVEQAETFLRDLGFYNIRVRVHTARGDSRERKGSVARIEVDILDFPKVLACREQISGCLHALGFQYVTFDLDGFQSGSMDIGGQIS